MPNSFTTVSGVSFTCLSLFIRKRVIETVPPDFSPRLTYLNKCKKFKKNREDHIKIYYRYFLYTHINRFARYSYSFRIRCKLQSLSHSSRIERKHFNDKERILYGKRKKRSSLLRFALRNQSCPHSLCRNGRRAFGKKWLYHDLRRRKCGPHGYRCRCRLGSRRKSRRNHPRSIHCR